jgi:cytochrome P450
LDHARIRKLMAHAFSDAALVEQQPLLQAHIGVFIGQLQARADAGETVDMNMWFNLLAFDAITDLSFGEPLGGLHDGQKHPFIGVFFASCRLFPFIPTAWTYPAIRVMLTALMSIPSFKRQQENGYRNTEAKVQRRMDKGELADRKDFMTYVCAFANGHGLR